MQKYNIYQIYNERDLKKHDFYPKIHIYRLLKTNQIIRYTILIKPTNNKITILFDFNV